METTGLGQGMGEGCHLVRFELADNVVISLFQYGQVLEAKGSKVIAILGGNITRNGDG